MLDLDLVTGIITAATLAPGTSSSGRASAQAKTYSTKEIERIIFKQYQKLGNLITDDPEAFNENVENFLDNASKEKMVNTDSKYDNYFNEAQEIKIYLSYYLNRLNQSNNRQLSTLSTTHYREKPYNALIDGLKQNKEELKKIEILKEQEEKNKTGGKRKKTRRNKRKNKRKNKTKNKRKAKRKTKNKRKRKHRKTKKR